MLRAGLLNMRSVNNKIVNVDDLLDDHQLNIILMETWYEYSDCIAIKRLSGLGMNVFDIAQPIPNLNNNILEKLNFVNHDGLVVVSKPGINVARIESIMRFVLQEIHYSCIVSSIQLHDFLCWERPTEAITQKFNQLIDRSICNKF